MAKHIIRQILVVSGFSTALFLSGCNSEPNEYDKQLAEIEEQEKWIEEVEQRMIENQQYIGNTEDRTDQKKLVPSQKTNQKLKRVHINSEQIHGVTSSVTGTLSNAGKDPVTEEVYTFKITTEKGEVFSLRFTAEGGDNYFKPYEGMPCVVDYIAVSGSEKVDYFEAMTVEFPDL